MGVWRRILAEMEGVRRRASLCCCGADKDSPSGEVRLLLCVRRQEGVFR